MIQKMEIFSQVPGAPELLLSGFYGPSDDPVVMRNIEGLGPVKADISSTPLASGRGEVPQGSSTGKRNIVLTLGLNPDWAGSQTMSSLRQQLYRYLLPEQWTKLRIYSDELPVVDIEGIVESFEPNIFSQDPELQVSILCHQPDFIAVEADIHVEPIIDAWSPHTFEYVGTVPTGFELQIDPTTDAMLTGGPNEAYTGSLTITLDSDLDPVPQVFTVDPVTIDADKYFKLSTIQNDKRVQSIAVVDGIRTNLLGGMSAESVWPKINLGINRIKVEAAEDGQKWTLAYFTRFGAL